MLQILGAVALVIIAIATTDNLVRIALRPETISVVNTMIGQGVLIICALAMARILLLKGIKILRASRDSS